MSLSQRQIKMLNTIIETAKKVIATAKPEGDTMASSGTKRGRRRSSADAEKMKAQIRAARAKGVSAAKLAEKYGVSTAYVYMIR